MSSASTASLIPVTLLTGFLGSGKTTVLNHLMPQPEMADTLVIINEFGDTALDHLLVAHSRENLVMELGSGCVCCTIRGDLVSTLRDATWRFSRNGQKQFRRVLIETTGLADPAPIVHTLMTQPQIAPKYRLDGIVATVDMATGMHTLDRHPEAVKQAAMADALLLTKADLATGEQRAALLSRLDDINPAAVRLEVRNGEIEARKVLNLGLFAAQGKAPDVTRWLREEAYKSHSFRSVAAAQEARRDPGAFAPRTARTGKAHAAHHDANRHDDHIRAFCFTIDEPIAEPTLVTWLDVLMSFVGSDILRVKGILNVEGQDRPVVLHGVQHIFHPPVSLSAWPGEDRRSRLVFITRDVDRNLIERTFRAFQPLKPQAGESAA